MTGVLGCVTQGSSGRTGLRDGISLGFLRGEWDQFFTAKEEDVAGGVGGEAFVGLAFDGGDIEGPVEADEGVAEAGVVPEVDFGLHVGAAKGQSYANAVTGGAGVELGLEGSAEAFDGAGAGGESEVRGRREG